MYSGEPPAKKSKEQTIISMVVEDQLEQSSSIQRSHGYPWHLQLTQASEDTNYFRLTLHCGMSSEAELWKCSATVTTSLVQKYEVEGSSHLARRQCRERSHTFYSWDERSQQFAITSTFFQVGTRVDVEIATNDRGERWNPRPMFTYAFAPRDFTLVVEGTKKIRVDSAVLSEQSPYFERLFNDSKEKEEKEIPLEDVKFTELSTILLMIYKPDKRAYLSDDNAVKILQRGRDLKLQIVEDKVVSFLLSAASSMSIHEKLLLSEWFQIPFLNEMIIARYTTAQLKELSASPEFTSKLTRDTALALFQKSCALNHRFPRSPGSDSE